jgi:c-di-GMP-binding flagellar brake protein YcgR
MNFDGDYETGDLDPYRIQSRKEIIALLRGISGHNNFIRMLINGGHDTIVTSILKIDETDDTVLIDCAPTPELNRRIVDSKKLSFETVHDNIRILFSVAQVQSCMHDNLPAFRMPLPRSLIRLQRRDFFRVPMPVTNPVHCTIVIPYDDQATTVVVTLHNISGGGIAIVDEKKALDPTPGRLYPNCRIDLPGGAPLSVTLQVRSMQEVTLTNGKGINRLGCMFVDLPGSVLNAIQRYITKLERDLNAKTGLL